ncbi:MAG: hypothetical protein SFY56_03030 [Bacteroidota bacterium]|nr:hypothetical protein [Bacteroidota bacterium]
MDVYCTTRFITEIVKLSKNNSYNLVINDVCDYLINKSIQELHITNDLLVNGNDTYSLHKYRIKNSLTNKGKSSSYRCVSVCLPKTDLIILGSIYPKTGSDGIENLSKEEYKTIAKEIAEGKNNNTLKKLDIKNKIINI